jgi:hypothetical protein
MRAMPAFLLQLMERHRPIENLTVAKRLGGVPLLWLKFGSQRTLASVKS